MNNKSKALEYAERYGVIEYKVVGNRMIFVTNYPQEHNTYRVTVFLQTCNDSGFHYETRITLKNYFKRGNVNQLC